MFFISCQENEAYQDNDGILNKKNIETVNIFPPSDSKITAANFAKDWKEVYRFYVNDLSEYKDESYYIYSKGLFLSKIITDSNFQKNANESEWNYLLDDFFNNKIPSANLLLDFIAHYEIYKKDMQTTDLTFILNKNRSHINQLIENLNIIRSNSEYKVDERTGTNLISTGFEEKISLYLND